MLKISKPSGLQSLPPLVAAASSDDFPAMQRIIARGGVDVNSCCSSSGWCALHFASCNGNATAVKALLEAGADILQKTHAGFTALHLAAWKSRQEVCALLINSGASLQQVAVSHSQLLDCAFHVQLFEKTIERGVTALHVACCCCKSGSLKVLTQLLDADADINAVDANGDTPLMYSCRLSNTECAQLLLQRGANPSAKNSYEQTAVHLCCISGATAILDFLLPVLCPLGSSASSVVSCIGTGDKAGITPLHAACRHGHRSCAVSLLLPHLSNAGVCIDCRGPMGLTPLHLAAFGGHSDVCTLLVELKADINAFDGVSYADSNADWCQGFTPAGLAQAQGHLQTVSTLLQLGASDAGIDLEAVAAAVAIPEPRPSITPPSPLVTMHEPSTTKQSRPLNPAAPPLQMPATAVTMEQYTALMQQQWMQWGLYAQQYASMYPFVIQPVDNAGHQESWNGSAATGTVSRSS